MRNPFKTLLLLLIVFVLNACTENAKPARKQFLHLYSDILTAQDIDLFRAFEKKWHISVKIHTLDFASILDKLQTDPLNAGIDAVLLNSPLDLQELDKAEFMYYPKNGLYSGHWQNLTIDPYVFSFPTDSSKQYSTYGQIIRDERAVVRFEQKEDARQIDLFLSQLHKIYPKYSNKKLRDKFLDLDTNLTEKSRPITVGPLSYLSKKKNFVYPDQNFNGAFGIPTGLAVIRHSANRSNALLLFTHCQNTVWRKRFAARLKSFPILPEEENKERIPYLFQNLNLPTI